MSNLQWGSLSFWWRILLGLTGTLNKEAVMKNSEDRTYTKNLDTLIQGVGVGANVPNEEILRLLEQERTCMDEVRGWLGAAFSRIIPIARP